MARKRIKTTPPVQSPVPEQPINIGYGVDFTQFSAFMGKPICRLAFKDEAMDKMWQALAKRDVTLLEEAMAQGANANQQLPAIRDTFRGYSSQDLESGFTIIGLESLHPLGFALERDFVEGIRILADRGAHISESQAPQYALARRGDSLISPGGLLTFYPPPPSRKVFDFEIEGYKPQYEIDLIDKIAEKNNYQITMGILQATPPDPNILRIFHLLQYASTCHDSDETMRALVNFDLARPTLVDRGPWYGILRDVLVLERDNGRQPSKVGRYLRAPETGMRFTAADIEAAFNGQDPAELHRFQTPGRSQPLPDGWQRRVLPGTGENASAIVARPNAEALRASAPAAASDDVLRRNTGQGSAAYMAFVERLPDDLKRYANDKSWPGDIMLFTTCRVARDHRPLFDGILDPDGRTQERVQAARAFDAFSRQLPADTRDMMTHELHSYFYTACRTIIARPELFQGLLEVQTTTSPRAIR